MLVICLYKFTINCIPIRKAAAPIIGLTIPGPGESNPVPLVSQFNKAAQPQGKQA